MSPLSLQSTPPFASPVKASERIASVISEEHIAKGPLIEIFLGHLAKIEEIEVKLGREDIDKEEMETLLRLCHKILNEVHLLQLNTYVESAYIKHIGKT